MSDPKLHDDLSFYGRISETVNGTVQGLGHATKMLFNVKTTTDSPNPEMSQVPESINEHPYHDMPRAAAKASNRKQEKSLPWKDARTHDLIIVYYDHLAGGGSRAPGNSTFIYEQVGMEGNSCGSLRAFGHAQNKE